MQYEPLEALDPLETLEPFEPAGPAAINSTVLDTNRDRKQPAKDHTEETSHAKQEVEREQNAEEPEAPRRVTTTEREAEYLERRRRNTEAVRKCRAKKSREEQLQRARFAELESRVQELTAENVNLREESLHLQQLQPLSPSMSEFLEVLEHLDSQLPGDWTLQAPWTPNPFHAGLDLLNPFDRAESSDLVAAAAVTQSGTSMTTDNDFMDWERLLEGLQPSFLQLIQENQTDSISLNGPPPHPPLESTPQTTSHSYLQLQPTTTTPT